MNLPLSPQAQARQVEQRSEYLASMPRKIDCLTLLLAAWERNPENAEALSAIMAMIHQMCGSAALHQCDGLQKAAEQCRDRLQNPGEPATAIADSKVRFLLDEMRLLET